MPEQTRKLAAIVFTDIVGYTKLASDNQSKASALLKQQRDLFQPIVSKFNGSWIKEVGDGLILTFDTVTDAVNCCIKLQETSKQTDNLDLRIGIHQGEIIIEENDIIGDDVNVASRIEPFSAPGGIAISNKVHDAIVRESEFTTKYLGKPKLKGVGQKVEVYCITSHDLPETDLSKVSAKLEPEGFQWNVKNTIGIAASVIGLFMLINFMFLRIGYADKDETPSIAILPFENKGAEADEYYAYGISSDLITDVTGAGLIRVAGLKDIEKLDYANMSYDELSNKLFVRYVAQGTLWKMDSVFQLSMEIFDTKSSKVVYNKRWETAWKDLATIKDDLSDNILETLKIEVLRDVEGQIVESNPEAYEYYLKAKYKLRNRKNIEDIEVARGLLNKAIKLNNNLIPAKNLLGMSYEIIGEYDKALDIFNSNFKQAKEFDDKNQICFTQKRIGDIYSSKGEYDDALAFYEKSLLIAEEIDSKSGIGSLLSEIGVVNFYRGNYDIALENWEKSLEIAELLEDKDLISQNVFNIGNSYWVKGDHDKALERYEKTLAIEEELGKKAGLSTTLTNLGAVYSYKGDLETALGYYERALIINEELGNKEGMGWVFQGMQGLYYNKGDYDLALDYAERSLKICEKIGDKRGLSKSVEIIGYFYYVNGEYGKAVEYFERSLSLKDELGFISDYKISPTVYLYLIYKNLDKEYDEQKILSLLESVEKIDYDTNFRLYELLEDKSYLENAYKKIQERTDAMSDELKQKFLNYPIPKQIIQEWKGVS